jgi:hypothetical protein
LIYSVAMIKKDPEGYKKLLVYKKADELHGLVLELSEIIERVERGKRDVKGNVDKILLELAHQLGRAARSPKSNIVEGWKRNTTKEYFDYLGFSIASIEEMREDISDIIKGKYKKIMGEKGIMGEMGFKDEAGIIGEGETAETVEVMGEGGMTIEEVDKLPFYPLDPLLPFVVQIYLRCKELTMLLNNLQQSLEQKMQNDGTLSVREKLRMRKEQEKEADEWLQDQIKKVNTKAKRAEGE